MTTTKPCAAGCGTVLTRREGEKPKRFNERRFCSCCAAARRRVGLRLGPAAQHERHIERKALRPAPGAKAGPMRFEDAPEAIAADAGLFRLARPATAMERASSAANAVVG